ncbi:MAG TPA: hypothetical protein VKR06_08410 [Ktedonosporobacter sp.]|nr:hypothetical protein [Ktedonosporobacter sp.]
MQTLMQLREEPQRGLPPPRRKYFSPSVLIGIIVVIISLVVLLPGPGVLRSAKAAQQGPNLDCVLIVPANPLSSQGLATPYQLTAANPQNGPCNESNIKQTAFVEGAIFDPANGTISVYDPLVIDQGTQPAIVPTPPVLPANAIVALWFGSNGNTLVLQGTDAMAVVSGNCVNGGAGTIFGQFSYCNAPAFFQAVYGALTAGHLSSIPPALGMGMDGLPCPSIRDFGIVDQDQSDNVTTQYLVTASGQTAQYTTANLQALAGAQALLNGSDNRVVTRVDGAVGCHPWTVTDLADPVQKLTALPLNEIDAQVWQNEPVALIPNDDPMVLLNGQPNLNKLNAYRQGVGQPLATDQSQPNTMAYCANLLAIAPKRLQIDQMYTQQALSPDLAVATNLFTFLAQRFVTTWGKNGLNCQGILHIASPVNVQMDKAGVTTAATVNLAGAAQPANGKNQPANGTTTDENNN